MERVGLKRGRGWVEVGSWCPGHVHGGGRGVVEAGVEEQRGGDGRGHGGGRGGELEDVWGYLERDDPMGEGTTRWMIRGRGDDGGDNLRERG